MYDRGLKLYATTGTAQAIASMGVEVVSLPNAAESDDINRLMESGELRYIIYTGAVKDATMGDYIALHRRAMQLGIPCLTSLDTANALVDIIASRFTEDNTELVDINTMRPWRRSINFTKMQSCGNDYIFIENFDNSISCPESLCVNLCKYHYSIGGDGIVLMERSSIADVKMRSFNRDGSESPVAGNNVRCVAKYMYDKGYIRSENVTVESGGTVSHLKLFPRDGRVSSVVADMGKASFEPESVPVLSDKPVINQSVNIDGTDYNITCLSMGNPHCVVFYDAIDSLNLKDLGPKFENAPMFPDRANTEFVRVVGRNTLRLRVWERGTGETLACGTGACAAVAAAVVNGYCDSGVDIKVILPGGNLIVNYTPQRTTLTGSTTMVFEGRFEY
jgi:carbamoyl-phosphate synthase large subunit